MNSENHDKITEIRFEYEQNSPICSVIENQNSKLEDTEKIVKLQRECPELSDLIKYLETSELPQDNKKARSIMLEKDQYRIGNQRELIHQY